MKMQTLLLGALLSLSAPLLAADTDVDATIEYRQGVYRAMEWNLTRLAAQVQGRTEFNADDFARRAGRIAMLSQLLPEGFSEVSSRGDEVKTRASYRIWQQKAQFDQLMMEMQQRSQALQNAVSGAEGVSELRPLVGRLAQSCKACHDKYRE